MKLFNQKRSQLKFYFLTQEAVHLLVHFKSELGVNRFPGLDYAILTDASSNHGIGVGTELCMG